MLSENGANSEAYIPKQVHASTEDVTSWKLLCVEAIVSK
jgi:hypothetical protein